MFRRVLIPLDGSAAAERVVHQIDVLVPPGLTEILLVHVARQVSPLEGRTGLLVEEGIRQRMARLADPVRRLGEVGIPARAILRRGEIAEQIIGAALDAGADLIAMATHGRGPIGRLLLGSVADEVVRGSPVPVLLVRSEARALPPGRILVPLDGSARSFRILPYVMKMARGSGSWIALLYVGRENDPDGVLPLEHLDRPAVAFVERHMQSWARRLRAKGACVNVVTTLGDPTDEILRLQEAEGFDLVAMCTHGRTGFERLAMGSVTQEVLRKAGVPLLVLRPRVGGALRKTA